VSRASLFVPGVPGWLAAVTHGRHSWPISSGSCPQPGAVAVAYVDVDAIAASNLVVYKAPYIFALRTLAVRVPRP
jgi:hypothetical protein